MEETFVTKILDQDISLYGENKLSEIIKQQPEYIVLPEDKKKILLPEGKDSFIIDRVQCTAKVNWSVSIDAREWGIKSFGISIQDVQISMDVEIAGFDSDDNYMYFSIDDIELNTKEFTIIDKMEYTRGMLAPDSIEIDFNKKEIEIS